MLLLKEFEIPELHPHSTKYNGYMMNVWPQSYSSFHFKTACILLGRLPISPCGYTNLCRSEKAFYTVLIHRLNVLFCAHLVKKHFALISIYVKGERKTWVEITFQFFPPACLVKRCHISLVFAGQEGPGRSNESVRQGHNYTRTEEAVCLLEYMSE